MFADADWGITPLTKWATGSFELSVGMGSGQRRSPFSCDRRMFDEIVAEYGFSEQIIRRVKAKESYFEHVFSGGDWPNILEIAASTYEHDAFLCLIRYEISIKRTRCLLFIKDHDGLKETTLDLAAVVDYIKANFSLEERQPLQIFNVILSLLQSRAHDFLRWRQKLYNIEARIGVSADLEVLRKSQYSDIDYDFGRLNADLTSIAQDIADNELSVATILDHARGFLRVVDICERLLHPTAANSTQAGDSAKTNTDDVASQNPYEGPPFNYLHEEVQSTISRAEMYLKHTKMTNNVLTSLTAALYNRINKSDTRSMKTIAVVTLFFLPSLFVASIFSTGIFNFQAGENPGEERVISRYGWIYLLATLLLTAVTLVVWTIWFVWGEMWLDNLRERRNSLRRAQDTLIVDTLAK
jgi:hypothetical protein